MNICFLGAGAFGKALAKIAEQNGHTVNFYDPIVFPKVNLKDAISEKDLIIYTAPSDQHSKLLPKLDKKIPLICASKGFLSMMPFKGFKHFSALGGAAFAKQINDKEPITLTASSPLAETIFSTENITVEYTKDTLGIMLCGALKNIYAIGVGGFWQQHHGDQLCYPQDITKMREFIEMCGAEIELLLKKNGAKAKTLWLSCGFKDLLNSCSDRSRNFRYGRQLAKGKVPESVTVEGLNLVRALDAGEFPNFVIPIEIQVLPITIDRVITFYKTGKTYLDA